MNAAGHDVFDIDLAQFGGSALTGAADVPKDRNEADRAGDIPVTYVPARNTVFLSIALARVETLDCTDIFIGVNALDYSGYPDCRPAYIEAFETTANLATKSGVEASAGDGRRIIIHAPANRSDQGRYHCPRDRPRRRLFPDHELLRSSGGIFERRISPLWTL